MQQIIKDYLIENQKLNIKGLGTLTIQYKSSEMHPVLHKFTVPGKYVVFEKTAVATTDAEFLQLVAKNMQISESEAEEKLDELVQTICQTVNRKESYALGSMGSFVENAIGQIAFESQLDWDISPESCGLENFEVENIHLKTTHNQEENHTQSTIAATSQEQIIPPATPVEKEQEAEEVVAEQEVPTQQPQKVKKKRSAGIIFLLVLLAIVLLLLAGMMVLNVKSPETIVKYKQMTKEWFDSHWHRQAAVTETPAVEEDEVFDDIIPESEEPDMEEFEEEITAEEEPVAVEEIPSEEMAAAGYYIVIGSFKSEGNAEAFLKNKSGQYADICHLGQGKSSGLYMVGIGPYSHEEAQHKIINDGIKGWILKK